VSRVIKGVVLAGAIIATGGALGVVLGPAGAGLLASASGIFAVTNALAAGAFLSGLSAQLTGKKTPRYNLTLEYSGTIEPRRIIYGQVLTSGMNALPPVTTGTNNKYLHQVLVLAGHEVYDITTVYFGQDAFGTIGSITGASTDGLVSTGAYANKAWIRRYKGTSSQTADYILDNALSIWTSNHRGRGVAYIAAQYELDESVYKNGKEELTAIVKGKICYDPRLDSSPGADPTNASYAAWTSNPALCLADYLTDANLGLGESTARIDWDMVADAADICDETVTVPTASTQTRYTCNLVLIATNRYEDNITALAACMLGTCLYSGGKWRIRAGAWEVASFQITDANVMGSLSVVTALDYKERFNGVRGSFVDPNNNYQDWEFPAVSNASYVTADGESAYKDIQLSCTNVYEAQRTAILLTRKSRNVNLFSVVCDLTLWKVRPGDTGIVTITELGLTAATVRCESWKFTPEGLVSLTLREELASDWNDPLEADYLTPTNISNPTPVYFTPSAPSGLTATPIADGVYLTWTAPALVPSGAKYEVYQYTSSTPFASATKVWDGYVTNCVIYQSDQTTRYYWVMLRMPDGTAGTEYPTSTSGIPGHRLFVADNKVYDEPSDGSQAYSSGTAPVIEVSGLGSHITYTEPTGAASQVMVNWNAQARISNLTSGTATGEAFIGIRIIVNGSDVWNKKFSLESYTGGASDWASFSGSKTLSLPANQAIDVYLQTYREFTTSGLFPAQTMYWRSATVDLLPIKRA
jgi:hypothetical protein